MKNSTEPTGYILIKTFSTDEFLTCDFAVVEITEDWKALTRKRLEVIQSIASDATISHLVYWQAPCDFYNDSENHPTAEEIIGDEEDWCYVEISKPELAKLKPTEMALDFYQTLIDRYGNISFKVSGKHTTTEFSTSEINLTEIL